MPFTCNSGIRIHYQVCGTGRPIVLHHGLTSDLNVWHEAGYVRALEADHRLILVDARGHGLSDKPHDPAAYRVDERVRDVTGVLDELGIERAVLLGYSMGGLVGFAAAKFAPRRLSALIAGGASPIETAFEEFSVAQGDDAAQFIATLERFVGEALRPEVRRSIWQSDVRAYAANLAAPRVDLLDALDAIGIPTMLFAGTDDRRAAQVEECARRISGASFMPLKGLNHAEAFQHSAPIAAAVRTFLRAMVQ